MKATVTKISKRLTVVEQRYDGVYSYDIDNNYPARCLDIVSASTMGKACLAIYRKFIFGKGFADETFAKTALNRWGETADKILEKTAKNYAAYGGFALHVNYNANYKISDIQYMPLAQVRITTPDNKKYAGMYAVRKDWAVFDGGRNKGVRYIDKFNPDPEVIQQQVVNAGGWQSYKGQIFYFSNEDKSYPLPIYDAALEDMQTDAQAKTYKFRNVTTNFMASHILFIDPIESNDDEKNEDSNDDEKNTFISDIEQYQGADNAQKILVVERTSPEQKMELEKVDQQTGDRLYEWTEQSVRDNIRQAFQIPAALIMQTPGKLGTAQEMIDATKTYNSVTEDERLTIEAAFTYLAELFERSLGDDFSIQPREAIRKEDVPQAVLQDLTRNERRALAGYPELPEGDDQTLAEKLQVGGTQSFVGILQNGGLTADNKAGILKVLFNLTDEQIKNLNLTDPKPADDNKKKQKDNGGAAANNTGTDTAV